METRGDHILLCILDGWGHAPPSAGNAIHHAATPVYDSLMRSFPHTYMSASGTDVGLPQNQFGNSEVGHTHIAAGRVVRQSLLHIDSLVANDTFCANKPLQESIAQLKASGGTAHVMGLVSPGGVHGHQEHLNALLHCLAKHDVPIALHAFLDGRDTAPSSALAYMTQFLDGIKDLPNVTIASLCGRYYAMDRDRRWQRTHKAWLAIARGKGNKHKDPLHAIRDSYEHAITDEFFVPTVIGSYAGMRDGDGLFMTQFRADRVRQILLAFLDPDFDDFPREHTASFATTLGLQEYSLRLNRFIKTMFPPFYPKNTLGALLAEHDYRQMRIAETEKYAHVTYFFNGGIDRQFEHEERQLLPSPRVRTYDLAPEMAAQEVADATIDSLQQKRHNLIVVNFANADMVGHTGILPAVTRAVEKVDSCLGRVLKAAHDNGYRALVTADHGNAECMYQGASNKPHTAHTTNPVPFIVADKASVITPPPYRNKPSLQDIAPTILSLMGLAIPQEMTGHPLIANPLTKRKRAQQ